MRLASLLFLVLSFSNTFAQGLDTLSRNDRLKLLAAEVHDLTRQPLGEGDVVFNNWIELSYKKNGVVKISRVLFSDTDSSAAWVDNINDTRSYFFSKSDSPTIYTVIPEIEQGTTLSEDLMKALGYTEIEKYIDYVPDEKAEEELITGRVCHPAKDDSTTVWVAKKSELKKAERSIVKRGVKIWASNQTKHSQIRSYRVDEGMFALGFDYDGIEVRVIDFGSEGDFTLALDKIKVNIPGRDLKSIADEQAAKKQTD